VLDLLMMVAVIAAFVVAAGYVLACEDLTGGQKDSKDSPDTAR
jgi:hypothetical protein